MIPRSSRAQICAASRRCGDASRSEPAVMVRSKRALKCPASPSSPGAAQSNSAHSSERLFCTGVPEMTTRHRAGTCRAACASCVLTFFTTCPSSSTTQSQPGPGEAGGAASPSGAPSAARAAGSPASAAALWRSIPYVVTRTPPSARTPSSASRRCARVPSQNWRVAGPSPHRPSSAAQCAVRLTGATISARTPRPACCSPRRKADTCIVFPRPMSSARIPPRDSA